MLVFLLNVFDQIKNHIQSHFTNYYNNECDDITHDNTPDDILTTVQDKGLNTHNKIAKKSTDQQFLNLNIFNKI